MNAVEHRPGLKTWSALMGSRRRPSEYEVVSYKLHYRTRNPDAPYEQSPDLAMNQWYRTNVFGSPLQHPDWDSFRDPDEVTYRAYCAMQDGQEQYVDGLLSDHDDRGHDVALSAEWVRTLNEAYTPGRYMLAGLQMGSAYLLQMAPASTITNCAAFQEADQLRWLSRLAYRTRELANSHPERGFGENERTTWESAPHWQGFRELQERALTAFDWGECFVALNLVVARAVDAAFIGGLGDAARAHGDTLTAMLLDNQGRDSLRARRWTKALVKQALEVEANAAVLQGWLDKWTPLADRAIDAYCSHIGGREAADKAKAQCIAFWAEVGLA